MPIDGYNYEDSEFQLDDEQDFGMPKVQGSGGIAPGRHGGGTGFVNLGQIMGINRASGEAQASKMTGDIRDRAVGVQSKLGGMESEFNKQMNQVNQISDESGVNTSAQAAAKAGAAEAMKLSGLDENKGWTDLGNEAHKVSQDANAVGSSPGRAGMLMGQGLSGGEAALDMFTMGMNNSKFADTKNQFGNLSKMLGFKESDARNKLIDAKSKLSGAATKFRGMQSSMSEAEEAKRKADEEAQIRAQEEARRAKEKAQLDIANAGSGIGLMRPGAKIKFP